MPPWPELPEGALLLVGAVAAEGIRAAAARAGGVWLWERSAPLLRALLEAADLSDPLRTGALRLLLDVDLFVHPAAPSLAALPRVRHPAIGYDRELAWLDAPEGPAALLVDGGLLVEELARALVAEGRRVWTWETTRLPPAELVRIARAVAPKAVYAVNHQPGLPEAVEELAAELPGLRLHVWEIDPALEPVQPPRIPVPRTTIHTWRRAQVAAFEAAGFRAGWLPLASDPVRRAPPSLAGAAASSDAPPIAFVGRSMVDEARRCQAVLLDRARAALAAEGLDPDEAPARLDRVLAAQRAAPEQFRIPTLLAEHLPGLLAAPTPDGADPVQLVGEIAASEWRLTVLANLGRFGAEVWGDEGWSHLAPHGVRWRGPAGHHRQLTAIYGSGAIHVDIGRLYQLDIVTLRVFDALACGGFVLAQHSADLEALFDVGREVESWRTLPELLEKVAHWLPRPAERAAMAARGRARVLRDHTVAQRLRAMDATALPAPGPR